MRRRPLRRAAGVLAGLALFGAAAAARADSPALEPCRVAGLEHEVLCGRLQRPLDPQQPQARTIGIHYVVVPARARRKKEDPVFLLAGGPGQSAIAVAPSVLPLLARLNNRRDLVFVDQRGTGRSAALVCEDSSRLPLARQAELHQQVALLHACRDALGKRPELGGVDGLRFFTTSIAMADLEAVRQQLGAPAINLVGGSYGTRAALEYLRLYPSRVRRALLDGVAPPDMVLPASQGSDVQAAMAAMFRACEVETACRRRHPTLRADWDRLLAGLPRPVSAAHPLSGEEERFTLTRAMVLNAVRGPLYVPSLAAALPEAIDQAAQGRVQGLIGLSSLLGGRRSQDAAAGMHFSVVCAEDMPRLPAPAAAQGAELASDITALYRAVCAGWPRGSVAPDFYRIPPSPVPVLLLSGGLDPVTPPRHGERVAQALGPRARHVVVANAGHGVLNLGCMGEVLYRFIEAADDAAARNVEAGCAQAVPRPPAFEPMRLEPAR